VISRDKALKLVRKYIKTENTIKHMLALEAIMRALAEKLEPNKADEWAMAGLLHDLDYEMVDQKTYEGHGLKTIKLLKKAGADLPESVYKAITAHTYDWLGDQYAPQTKMEWAIYIADSLTGLIVATALVRPSKKIADVKVKSIKKKFKDKGFAAGTRREAIALCEEKLSIPLAEFFEIALTAMKNIASDLGL
jgi:putative nucleotidyltransferase with HDIG domain